jgi:hypothetical protein
MLGLQKNLLKIKKLVKLKLKKIKWVPDIWKKKKAILNVLLKELNFVLMLIKYYNHKNQGTKYLMNLWFVN